MFHFVEFGKLNYVHHTIDTYSGFQWTMTLSSAKAYLVITYLLEVMSIMGMPVQIKTDNGPAYVALKMKQYFAYYKAHYRYTIYSYTSGSYKKIKLICKGEVK